LCPGARIKLTPFPAEQQAIDIGNYVADIAKIRQAVRWRPRVSLRDGLVRMIAYYEGRRAEYW